MPTAVFDSASDIVCRLSCCLSVANILALCSPLFTFLTTSSSSYYPLIPPPPGLQEVYEEMRAEGAICIADEVRLRSAGCGLEVAGPPAT